MLTNLPGIAQWHHMVDINIAAGRPCGPIVRALPRSTGRGASGINHYASTITLQHRLARIAGTRYGDPVRKQITAVAGLRALSCDGERRELGLGCCGGWDVRRRGHGHGVGSTRYKRDQKATQKKGGLHDEDLRNSTWDEEDNLNCKFTIVMLVMKPIWEGINVMTLYIQLAVCITQFYHHVSRACPLNR